MTVLSEDRIGYRSTGRVDSGMLDLDAIFDDARVRYQTPDDLPEDWREEWGERAAVREYDGGQHREHAEAEAFCEILERMRLAGLAV